LKILVFMIFILTAAHSVVIVGNISVTLGDLTTRLWGMAALSFSALIVFLFGGADRRELIHRLKKGGNGIALTEVDQFKGPLGELAIYFHSQLQRAEERPTYLNLVDLCGATRTCWHRAASEWWLNRTMTTDAVGELRELTIRSKNLLEKSATSHVLR